MRDDCETDLATRDDLFAERCTHELALARLTRELLAQIAADDHLGGDQLDDLGDVVADARPLGAARRTRALLGGNEDRVIDTWSGAGARFAGCLGGFVLSLERSSSADLSMPDAAQLGVRFVELVGTGIFLGLGFAFAALKRVDEEHKLCLADLLTLLEAIRDPRKSPRHVRVLGDELATISRMASPSLSVINARTTSSTAELVARRQCVRRRIRRRARLAIHVAHLGLSTIARKG